MSSNDEVTANNIINTNNNNTQSSKNNRANLIVNYLPQSLKEQDFNQLFSKIGPIKTCKLMYDKQTGYSYGYGFVEYVNEEDALKAIDSLNGFQIEHKRLKVALARPNCEETKNTNLYIRNIPITFEEQMLHSLFSQYGDVVQVRLLRDQNTTFSRRIGFVIMATKQMAQLAIQNLDNTIPTSATEPIYVKYADEEGKKRNSNLRMTNSNNTYLTQASVSGTNPSGFNYNPNQYMLPNTNQQNGLNPLAPNLKMKTNRSNGHQNRFNPIGATVGINSQQGGPQLNAANNNATPNFNTWNMSTNGIIQQSYSNFGNTGHNNLVEINGLSVNTSNPIGSMAMDTSKPNNFNNLSGTATNNGHIIYVYGLGQANESELYSLFSNCGRILRVNIIKNTKTGQSKGYGFVVFETYEEAYFAVHNMNGYMFNHRPLQVQLNAVHLD